MNDLCKLTARQAVDLLRKRELSPVDLVEAALSRIQEVDGCLNALPTVCADRALLNGTKIAEALPLNHERWIIFSGCRWQLKI